MVFLWKRRTLPKLPIAVQQTGFKFHASLYQLRIHHNHTISTYFGSRIINIDQPGENRTWKLKINQNNYVNTVEQQVCKWCSNFSQPVHSQIRFQVLWSCLTSCLVDWWKLSNILGGRKSSTVVLGFQSPQTSGTCISQLKNS